MYSLLGSPEGAAHYLHDQRHRELEDADSEGAQKPRHFPTDEAATKLILALRNILHTEHSPITWRAAKTQFAILFAKRFTAH